MKRILLSLSVLLLVVFQRPLGAQAPHPCDLPEQTGPLTVSAGTPFTLSWCHNGKDPKGAVVSITGWRLVRNTDVAIPLFPTPSTTMSASGFTNYSVPRAESVVGVTTYSIYGVSGAIDGLRASITFTVTVVPSSLSTPTNVRIVQ